MSFDTLLPVHFSISVLMTVAGLLAIFLRKGSRPHRWAGRLFLVLMLGLIGTGATLISLRPPAYFQGWVAMATVYLVVTGWATARHRGPGAGRLTAAGALLGGSVVAAGVAIMIFGGLGANGMVLTAGFATLVLVSTALDIRVIVRGGIAGPQRTARHLWRMGLALVITAGSTAGHPEYFPQVLRPFLLVPMGVAAVVLAYWLVRTLWLRKGLQRAPT